MERNSRNIPHLCKTLESQQQLEKLQFEWPSIHMLNNTTEKKRKVRLAYLTTKSNNNQLHDIHTGEIVYWTHLTLSINVYACHTMVMVTLHAHNV